MKERVGNPGAFLIHQSAEAPPVAPLPQQSADLTQGRAGGSLVGSLEKPGSALRKNLTLFFPARDYPP